MYVEEKIDLLINEIKTLSEKVELFLPNLEDERGVIHFLEITKNTFNNYLNSGVFIEGVHFVKNGNKRKFVSSSILKLKQSGIKGKRKVSNKQDTISDLKMKFGLVA
jgi:hypothetical protein